MSGYSEAMNGKAKKISTKDYLGLIQKAVDAGFYAECEAKQMITYAMRDDLTGLYNKKPLKDHIEDSLEGMSNRRKSKGLSVIYIDLDKFKPFNEKYGHNGGDKVLRRFARVLNKACRRTDTMVHRPHGDEFVIVLPDTDDRGAKIVVNKISETFDEAKETFIKCMERRQMRGYKITWPENEVNELIEDVKDLTYSSGYVTIGKNDSPDVEGILNGADRKMLETKHSKSS